jgi:hypothetical protein
MILRMLKKVVNLIIVLHDRLYDHLSKLTKEYYDLNIIYEEVLGILVVPLNLIV